MLLFILEQLGDLTVIPGKAGLPGAALTEGEVLPGTLVGVGKAVEMDIDALAAVLCAAQKDPVPRLEPAELHHLDLLRGAEDGDAVHAGFPGQDPAAVDLEIFRADAQSVVAGGGDAVLDHGGQLGVGGVPESGNVKIRRVIGFQRKRHKKNAPLQQRFQLNFSIPQPSRERNPALALPGQMDYNKQNMPEDMVSRPDVWRKTAGFPVFRGGRVAFDGNYDRIKPAILQILVVFCG